MGGVSETESRGLELRSWKLRRAGASIAAHEIVHATDPQNMADLYDNQNNHTNKDVESKPEKRETEILQNAIQK